MSQIITNKAIADRCNLRAIQEGGSQANTILALGEIWLVDSTDSTKGTNGYGKYDKYIVGDGITAASGLVVHAIDDLSGKQNLLTFDSTPTESSLNPVTSGGIKDSLDTKANIADVYNKTQIDGMIVPHDSALVVVTSLPSTGTANTIYRLYTEGGSSYSDNMYVSGTGWIELAEYDNAIDATPTQSSDNLVKSGGVYSSQESLRSSLQGNIDTLSGTVNAIQFSTRTTYAFFVYDEPGKVIDARTASDTYGQAITCANSMCVTGFIPLMGATKIKVKAMVTSADPDVYGIAGMVAYDAERNPVGVVQAVTQGDSTTYEDVVWTVSNNAEYIRFSLTITNTNLNAIAPVQLIYDINDVLDYVKEDSLLLIETANISTSFGGWVVNPSSSNYNKHAAPGNLRYNKINVSNVDYVGASFANALKSNNYNNYGCLFVDSDDNVIENVCHVGVSSSTTDTGNKYSVFKVPTGAQYLKATFYGNNNTNPSVDKFRKSAATKVNTDLQSAVTTLQTTVASQATDISTLESSDYRNTRNIAIDAKYNKRSGMMWATSNASTSVFSSFVRTPEPTGKRVRVKCIEPYLSVAAMQSGAISGNLLVCASADSGNVVFYSMLTGRQQYSSGMIASYSGHNNCAFFGTEKYLGTDTYPLLYFTGSDMPIRVYRITGTAFGDFQLNLVQTINPPSTTDTGYTTEGVTGAALYDGSLYVWGLVTGQDSDSRTVMKFPMPSLQEGETVNLDIADREPFSEGVYSFNFTVSSYSQGAYVKDKILYLPDYYGIVAVDLVNATRLGRLNLRTALPCEVETVFMWMGDWYITAVNRTDEVTAGNTVQIYYVELVES